MKPRVRTIDVVIGVIIIAGVILAGWFFMRQGPRATSTTADPDAQAFVNESVQAIFAHWDVDELHRLGDPVVYDGARITRARQNFKSLSERLGPFVSYSGAHGTTDILATSSGEVKHASYDAVLVYRNGSLEVHMDADKMRGKWIVRNASMQPLLTPRR